MIAKFIRYQYEEIYIFHLQIYEDYKYIIQLVLVTYIYFSCMVIIQYERKYIVQCIQGAPVYKMSNCATMCKVIHFAQISPLNFVARLHTLYGSIIFSQLYIILFQRFKWRD